MITRQTMLKRAFFRGYPPTVEEKQKRSSIEQVKNFAAEIANEINRSESLQMTFLDHMIEHHTVCVVLFSQQESGLFVNHFDMKSKMPIPGTIIERLTKIKPVVYQFNYGCLDEIHFKIKTVDNNIVFLLTL